METPRQVIDLSVRTHRGARVLDIISAIEEQLDRAKNLLRGEYMAAVVSPEGNKDNTLKFQATINMEIEVWDRTPNHSDVLTKNRLDQLTL